ncbi:MAG: hypothetical protein AB1403_16995, partial [Candidatus Riflebacteria bacterium]
MLNSGRSAFLLLVMLLLFIQAGFALESGADVKSLFDRYQAVYQQYQDAVQSGADKQTLSKLATDLQHACADYYQSIGVKVDRKNDLPETLEPATTNESGAAATDNAGSISRKRRLNPFAEEFNRILSDISAPGAENRLPELQ